MEPTDFMDENGLSNETVSDLTLYAYRLLRCKVFASLEGTGLTSGQPKILDFLSQKEAVIQKDIALACGIKKPTAAKLLAGMEQCGLITCGHGLENKKTVYVRLTPYGRERAELVKALFLEFEQQAFTDITCKQQTDFMENLHIVRENLQRMTASQPRGIRQTDENSLHYCMMECQFMIYDAAMKYLSRIDLSSGQPKVLMFLKEHEGCQQSEIAQACHVKQSTVTSLLANMERKELITRNAENGNRRSLHVYVTAKGKKLLVLVERMFCEMNAGICEQLGPEQILFTRQILAQICKNLSEKKK